MLYEPVEYKYPNGQATFWVSVAMQEWKNLAQRVGC